MDVCTSYLNEDLNKEFGVFWHQKESMALYMETMKRVHEMKRVWDEKQRKMERDKMDRRNGMTPEQRTIDELMEKANAPCMYYDRHYVSRPCD